ncbi:MAG: hypothetical protein IPK79_00935 [Vampirovibrionales bacterium]|nr:hypothetical protein [Vampirovibrionales bacterium]
MFVRKEGGLSKRPGTRFIASTKVHAGRSRLIPFRFSTTQAYMIEAGAGYFRFYKDKAQIVSGSAAYEVASPYSEADVLELTYTQSFDVLYLFHAAHPPRALTRTGHTAWVLSDLPFSPPATYEPGHEFLVALVISAATGTVTLSAASAFLPSDVDRLVEAGGGQATIIGYSSEHVVTAQVNRPFPALAFGAQQWRIVGSPNTACTPDKKDPVGSVVTLTLATGGFRTVDVGKFVDIAGGFIELTGWSSATAMSGIIRSPLSATTAVGGGGWKLRSPAWGGSRGYPSCAGFHQQRFAFGGMPADPGRIEFSRSADFYNFTLGTKDDDALSYPLLEDDVHEARWIKTFGQAIAIGTDAGTWVVSSGISDPTITPTAVAASLESRSGAAKTLGAKRIGTALVYVHRSRRSIRALHYARTRVDGYDVEDLNVLATHVLTSPAVDWAFQEEREQTIWVARQDGQLAACTWLPEHQVMGWHRHITAGVVESVASIPGDPDDEVWLIVRRTVGGQTRRFVECFDPRFTLGDDIRDAFYVDCGLSYRGAPATTISGLGHLEGATVQVLADGMVLPAEVVTGGAITIDEPASVVHVGLEFVARVKPILPDVGSQDGTTAGRQRRIIKVMVEGMPGTQCWVGPDSDHLFPLDAVATRQMDQPVDIFTSEATALPASSYDDRYNLLIEHRLPAPFEVRSMAFLMESASS